MKKFLKIIILILIFSLTLTIQVYARAGGGGSGGGSGGGGSSGGGSRYHSTNGSGRSNPIASFLNMGLFYLVFASGTIVFGYRAHKAKVKTVRLMKQYEKLGINWDYKEIQGRIEKAYFEIQECWRRQDVEYAGEYLSKELKESWNTKLEWMKIRDEEVIQRNVQLLSAMPVFVVDEEGTDKDQIWYLIHGRMTGYYINKYTKKVLRGNTQPEGFYEYWLFIYEDDRWVLQEIRQKDEMDITQFSE